MGIKKHLHLRTHSLQNEIGVSVYDDSSVLLETKSGLSGDQVRVSCTEGEARIIARRLSPLYVVKSFAGCYASYGAAAHDDVERHELGIKPQEFVWTEDRSRAAHFVSKEAAKAVAKKCFPPAGARVVRVIG